MRSPIVRLVHCVRQRIRLITCFLCLTLTCAYTTHVFLRRPPYRFQVCNMTSFTDAYIGYDRYHQSTTSAISRDVPDTDLKHLCQIKSNWNQRLPRPDWPTDTRDWSTSRPVPCVHFCLRSQTLHKRIMVKISCDNNSSMISTKYTNSADEIFSVKFRDKCLSKVIDNCSKGNNPVPNVLHYVWYGSRKEFEFVHFLSFLSAVRYMRPCLILLHGNSIPRGNYWNYLLLVAPNVIHVERPLITTLYGHTLSYKEHGADVMRIEALQEYGGLYLDFDSVILRDLEPLRRHDVTMGHEGTTHLGNQFIMAKKGAKFLELWHEEYKNYKKNNWGWNSLFVPYQIAVKNPSLIHIESNRFTRPNYANRIKIYNENYDWSDNYAMHLYIREYTKYLDMDVIRTLNSTIGAVSRHILFGNKELCIN